MSSTRTMGVNVTDVHVAYSSTDPTSGAKLPLGFEYVEHDWSTDDAGPRTWIYIENAESSASLIAGTVVGRAAGSSEVKGILCPVSETASRVIGVAQHTIAAGSFGFVLKKGVGSVLIDTGVSANAGLQCGNGTAGRADAAGGALTHPTFGMSLATIGTGEVGTCWINCQGA